MAKEEKKLTKSELLVILENVDRDKLEALTKISVQFTKEELTKISKKVQNKAIKQLILTYI